MKTKIKAALLHLLFSIMVTGICCAFMLLHFYPSVFLDIENPVEALKILIPADIIIGPVLTFIIYKKGKWGLKFDLIAIALCQFIALGYGCWAIYSARPGFLVLHGDSFYIVPPNIDQKALAGTTLAVGPLSSPKVVYLFLPGDSAQRLKLAIDSTSAGIPVHWQAQYFKSINEVNFQNLGKISIKPELLRKKNNKKQSMLLDKITRTGIPYAFIPVIGSHSEKVIAVNLANKTLEKTLDIPPY